MDGAVSGRMAAVRDTAADRFEQALLAAGEGFAAVGRWEWTRDTQELRWSDNLFRIFGLEPGAITPTPQFVYAQLHGDDRERVMTGVAELLEAGELAPLDYRIVLDDGGVRHLRAILAVEEWGADGRPARVAGWTQDVTEQCWADRELAAHAAVADALTAWGSFEHGASGLLAALARAMECSAAVLWLPQGDVLVARVLWRAGDGAPGDFEALTRAARLPRGIDVPGRAWAEQAPAGGGLPVVSPVTGRCLAAAADGMPGMLAFPAYCGGDVLAVVELVSREETRLAERLARSLTAIGSEVGQFLARRRGDLAAAPLTPRQLEVLQLAAHGLSAKATAARLCITPATVESHLENAYPRLGVTDKTSAVAEALRLGLIA